MTLKTTKSRDRREVTVQVENGEIKLDAAGVSELISRLVALRADMQPVHGASFESGKSATYECDNMLWETYPSASRRGAMLLLHHAGLGWLSTTFSRAQVEDLCASFEFTLLELSSAAIAAPPANEPIPLRRLQGGRA